MITMFIACLIANLLILALLAGVGYYLYNKYKDVVSAEITEVSTKTASIVTAVEGAVETINELKDKLGNFSLSSLFSATTELSDGDAAAEVDIKLEEYPVGTAEEFKAFFDTHKDAAVDEVGDSDKSETVTETEDEVSSNEETVTVEEIVSDETASETEEQTVKTEVVQ